MSYIEEYVPINGINQYFLHYPSDHEEVVLMLHGGPGSSTAMGGHTLKEYWDFANLVYYDQRGTLKTLKRNVVKRGELNIDTLLEDLRQTIAYIKEKYQTNRIILWGQSWGSVLGTQYVLKYPSDVFAYVGNGHVVDTRREMRASYDHLRQTLETKGAKGDLKKLDALGDYPNVSLENYNNHMFRFGRLQSKHGQAINVSKLLRVALKSPVFKLTDLPMYMKSIKANKDFQDSLADYTIWDITQYDLPVYYILGRDDWQTPSTTAAEYFEKINAPHKKLYWVEDAGHITDIDNPKGFCDVMREIVEELRRR
ncbi:MAG: alpha/beta fold hydrolase [Defluviitaleaceae bacterium]|nr:alpha/beta fold hydrolase [Defluviitaleaceae bacterium]